MHEFDKITLANRTNKCNWRLDGKNQCEIDQVQKLAYFLLEEVPADVNGLMPHEKAHLNERMKEFVKEEGFATGEAGEEIDAPPPPPPITGAKRDRELDEGKGKATRVESMYEFFQAKSKPPPNLRKRKEDPTEYSVGNKRIETENRNRPVEQQVYESMQGVRTRSQRKTETRAERQREIDRLYAERMGRKRAAATSEGRKRFMGSRFYDHFQGR
jgi:hypothetical protein